MKIKETYVEAGTTESYRPVYVKLVGEEEYRRVAMIDTSTGEPFLLMEAIGDLGLSAMDVATLQDAIDSEVNSIKKTLEVETYREFEFYLDFRGKFEGNISREQAAKVLQALVDQYESRMSVSTGGPSGTTETVGVRLDLDGASLEDESDYWDLSDLNIKLK